MTGGQFIKAPARFLWKGKITIESNKQAIIEDVNKTSVEELLTWIKDTLV